MLSQKKGSSFVAEKSFLDTFYSIVNNLCIYKLPIIITNISEKRQIESLFYCLVVDDVSLVFTKRFPGKKIVYCLNLSDLNLDVTGESDQIDAYAALMTSLREVLVDIKSRNARILKKV
jgi:hypothetical protein